MVEVLEECKSVVDVVVVIPSTQLHTAKTQMRRAIDMSSSE